MHEERVRKRASSCLMIASSEPDLMQRSLTPDFALGISTNERLAVTPNCERKKNKYKLRDIHINTSSIKQIPVININKSGSPLDISEAMGQPISGNAIDHKEVRNIVTTCLTRAITNIDDNNQQQKNHTIPLAKNCVSSSSREEDIVHSQIIQESARELVTVSLSRALEQFQNEVTNTQ